MSEEDIDGAPLDESVEEIKRSKDKEAIFDDEEDIDGAPIDDEAEVKPVKKVAAFKTSQWNAVFDYDFSLDLGSEENLIS